MRYRHQHPHNFVHTREWQKVKEVDLSLWVRTNEVRPGQNVKQLPRLEMTFFDENRDPVGVQRLGPWHGTTTWSRKASKIAVPPKARLAVIMLGMFGAVGEADFDNVAVDVTVAK